MNIVPVGTFNHTRRDPAEPPSLPQCTILLADDDDDYRVTVAEALRLEGAQVIEASGGEAAIATLDRIAKSHHHQAPALVIMDLMMPVMSGMEALQRLRRSRYWAQLPVVVMTAVNDPMLPVRLNVPVVYKPEIDPLLTAVRNIVGV